MKEPIVSIYLENVVDPLSDISIKTFNIRSSIFSSYPNAEIVIDDPEGKFLSSLAITPGNLIKFVTAEGGTTGATENITPINFTPLRIMGIHNDGVHTSDNAETQLGSLGGDFIIDLCHPWMINSDWSNHAYREKASSIIRKLVAEKSGRGFEFTSVHIEDTDDTGNITRYKLGESEARFIHQKLLPYITINKQSSYSFVDDLGGFHLRSFANMYEATPKVRFLPPLSDAVATLWETKSKITQLGIYDGAWWISKKFTEQIGTFKKLLYLEDSTSQLSFVANLPYEPVIPGYTLMEKNYINNLAATDVSIYPFRNFEDAIRLNVNNNSIMNEFFQVLVTVDWSPDLATAGQTVELMLAGFDIDTPHWMNGRWLVAATDHFLKEGRYFSKYLLCRPALDKLPASVLPDTLYKLV